MRVLIMVDYGPCLGVAWRGVVMKGRGGLIIDVYSRKPSFVGARSFYLGGDVDLFIRRA